MPISFDGCEALEEIKVADENEKYSDDDGVLYEGSTLMVYPRAKRNKSYTVRAGTESIAPGAFYGASIENVELPKSVQTVGNASFGSCAQLTGIVVLGMNTTFDSSFSANGSVVVYGYPGSSASSAANGDNITFTAIVDEIRNINMRVGAELVLNYYVKLWNPGEEFLAVTLDGETYELNGVYDEATGLYRFALRDIPPQAMTSLITAKLMRGDEVIDTLEDYSVREYLDTLLAEKPAGITDEKYAALKILIVDMLNYGAAAQTYRNYNSDELANAGIVGGTEFVPLGADKHIAKSEKGTAVDGVKFSGVGVRFDYVNKIFFKFTAPSLEGITVTVNGVEAEIIAYGSEYIVYSDGIQATEFANEVVAVLKYGDTVVQTVTYNVESFIYEMQNDEGNAASLARALYNYGCSAVAYAAK